MSTLRSVILIAGTTVLIGILFLLSNMGAPSSVQARDASKEEGTVSTPTEDNVAEAEIPGGCQQNAPAKSSENPFNMNLKEFREAAFIEFNRCHRRMPPNRPQPSRFRASLDYPTSLPNDLPKPWDSIHPIESPEQYLKTVLDHVMTECGADHIDWDGVTCGWYHAPWMHELREPMRGLTKERSSRPGELHPSQTTRTENWAVSLYNDIGAFSLNQIWGDDRASPDTNNFAFSNGTVAVKLLFSLATPEQVPYLRYAKTWQIHTGEKIVDARLIQVDLLVKDARVKDGANADPDQQDLTGWVMGSYLYNGAIETAPRCDRIATDIEACEQARWRDRLVPIGLQWGNDPQMYTGGATEPVQDWLNDDVTEMFAALRPMSGHPPYLGRDGRMNGPVDNHRSTCLACHGRAVDFGRHEEDALRLVPFVAYADPTTPDYPDPSNAELQRFFSNLNEDQPFLPGTHSLDYSLQAMVGLMHFWKWVDGLPLSLNEKKKIGQREKAYFSPDAVSGDLKIVGWNIANLHHETGVALRAGTADNEIRREVDFEILANLASTLDADIVALQEIGSPRALARIFPPTKYHLVMSDRYTPGDEFKPAEQRDIYTAFAFRRATFPIVPKVKTVTALMVPHLEFDGRYGVASDRPTRAGMSVEFEYEQETYALLNVHLKSKCNQSPLFNPGEAQADGRGWRRFHCRTLAAQLETIENWFETHHALGHKVMIVGDFNRKLNDAFVLSETTEEKIEEVPDPDGTDDFWADLNDGRPLSLVKGPVGDNTVCWAGHIGQDKHHIDFIVAGDNVINEAQAMQIKKVDYGIEPDPDPKADYAGRGKNRLSDHCPTVLTLSP